MHSLSTDRYQVVLCGAKFAEAGDFNLLKQHRAFQQAVPFLLVAEGQDREVAQCALMQQGVEDIVVWPLVHGQLEESLRQSMCLYRTRLTMADRRQHLHTLHSCQSLPPRQTRRAIRRIEANLKDLARLVDDCEREAHKRAVDHLDLLGRAQREINHNT
jgi:DNA-binding NtrC family response regulator